MLLRLMPNRFAVARSLWFSTIIARRTLAYRSTLYILPAPRDLSDRRLGTRTGSDYAATWLLFAPPFTHQSVQAKLTPSIPLNSLYSPCCTQRPQTITF